MSTPHVFVAEDDPDVRMSIAEILREEGYDVGEYSSLDDAFGELTRGARPCVVLIDFLMPGMNGQQFLEAIRSDASLCGIPVVMITGARSAAPGVEVLRKPFDLLDLVAVVARHCRHGACSAARPSPAPDPL